MSEKKTTTQHRGGPMGGGPGRNIGAKGPKPKNFWGTVKRLFGYMSKRSLAIIAVFVLAIAAVIFQIQTPKILGEATTEIFKGVMIGTQQMQAGQQVTEFPIDFEKVGQIILIAIGMYVISAVFNFLQQFIMTRVSQRTVYELRRDLDEKMNRLPISYYDTHSNGDIMSRAINDMDNIASTLQQNLTQFITSVVTFIGVLWMMLTISWQLTLIALATVPLSLIVVMIVAPKSQKFFAAQQKSLGLLNDQVEETYGGHTVVKTFNHEAADQVVFEEENDRLYSAGWKAQFISAIIMPLMNFIKNLGYVFVAVLGGIKVANGNMTLGDVQAFLQYTNQFSQPITQIASLLNTIQSTVASAERVFEVLDEEEMNDEPSGLPVEDSEYKVRFDHVQFGYAPDKLLMTDFNLDVKAGEMVAIVGPTGAGKTTLINLLERFYDVSGGSIRYDGRDTRDLTRDELRSNISMVLQDTWLFTGSIYDNIHYGNEKATKEQVIAAAKAAHVDDFVRKLPEGYDTVLNEEASNISQGQRQLITIARAFLADPDVLILDEATSSVDTRTEILIQKAMGRLLENRTSFVVAHRLSTIRDADNIIVMNHGSIVETGNHEELMAQNGFYADLYNSQFSEEVA
ncbi:MULTISPECIES: ABC transporter ATP-binding protein [Enterococcus]|jgi:ATP-binding cassette subfamily B protein|uniref:ABC transporter, ATP-binding protein n=1 Tax=Enterococcus casseliflavus ATCC 12755 TaxID=888066 RepID=F0EG95_ENTCA|nr:MULTISPECIES: ABC transporter ATP-binding protein [Enterococcus]EPH67547.1 ABC transporter, ATP-binding protein [Enterococcus faecium 13.SD.W.09]EPH97426.1 ABC transporter, ATP-binding protein [Enterococcus faecalis 06-MB-DW-09]MBO1120661.1 ABC transporter ATP-binding protein [Enterococcus casseliflavus]OTO97121.1 ABC transporter ATP-binding protein/permease [Enterococcus faecium]EGC70815.1 ABC transporter, ATP-binding protein [Enterococcus casseliflavus ATCC 12755]